MLYIKKENYISIAKGMIRCGRATEWEWPPKPPIIKDTLLPVGGFECCSLDILAELINLFAECYR